MDGGLYRTYNDCVTLAANSIFSVNKRGRAAAPPSSLDRRAQLSDGDTDRGCKSQKAELSAPYSLAGSAEATTAAQDGRGDKIRAVMELKEPAGAAEQLGQPGPGWRRQRAARPATRYLGTCYLAAVVIALRPPTEERREIRVLAGLLATGQFPQDLYSSTRCPLRTDARGC